MLKLTVAALASLALLGAPSLALADTGSAFISELQFELIDLDLSDGVAAALTWNGMNASLYAEAESGMQYIFMAGALAPHFMETHGPQRVDVTGELMPDRELAAGNASARIGEGELGVSYASPTDGGYGWTRAISAGTFTLSPNTALRVTGVMSLEVSGPGAGAIGFPPGMSRDYSIGRSFTSNSTAQASIELRPLVSGAPVEIASERLSGYGSAMGYRDVPPSPSFEESLSRKFDLILTNWSLDSLEAQFSVRTEVNAILVGWKGEGITPVPEPSTWALSALGASLLLARRRRQAHVIA